MLGRNTPKTIRFKPDDIFCFSIFYESGIRETCYEIKQSRLNKVDGTSVDLNITKATAIRSGAGMLHLDKLPSGDYRLIVSDDILDDMTQFDNLEMIREN